MSDTPLEIVIRLTPRAGFTPRVLDATRHEIYRGETYRSPTFALAAAIAFINSRKNVESDDA